MDFKESVNPNYKKKQVSQVKLILSPVPMIGLGFNLI